MTDRLFKNDLPEDILHLILVYYDGRFKKRNGKYIFQIKYNKLYNNIYINLLCHFDFIMKSNIRNDIYQSCISVNNIENIQSIVRNYVKMRNLQYLYN